MAIGLLTLAVVTAQVASNFVAQGPSPAERPPPDQAATPGMTLAELDQRLAQIEELLTSSQHRTRANNWTPTGSRRTQRLTGLRGMAGY